MQYVSTAAGWQVDFDRNIAIRGDVRIRFAASEGRILDMVFEACAPSSLEEQCLVAGDAAAAIRAKLLSNAAQ